MSDYLGGCSTGFIHSGEWLAKLLCSFYHFDLAAENDDELMTSKIEYCDAYLEFFQY